MKYGYKEVRRLGADRLRGLCIEKNWYTCGTNEEYAVVLNMADRENITTNDIVEIATDICEHSNNIQFDEYTNVMYEIANRCYTFFEEA